MKFIAPLFFGLALFAFGQEEEVVPNHMRFIPLGEVPVWQEEIIEGFRVQKEYQPGEMPPIDIVVGVKETTSEPSRMYLRKFTKWFTFSGALEQLKIEQGKAENVSPFLTSPMPTALHTLGILYRDSEEMTWLKPRIKVVRDDLTVFPLGTMRFINLAHLRILVKIDDDEPLLIEPGASIVHPIAENGAIVQVTASFGDGTYRSIFNNEVIMRPGQRVQSFIYKAQSPPPANPVKFHFQPEIYDPPKNAKVTEESDESENQP